MVDKIKSSRYYYDMFMIGEVPERPKGAVC